MLCDLITVIKEQVNKGMMTPMVGSRGRATSPPPPVPGLAPAGGATPTAWAAPLSAPVDAAAASTSTVRTASPLLPADDYAVSTVALPAMVPSGPASVAEEFWLNAARDLQVAFDFLTPPSRRPAVVPSSASSFIDCFGDLCRAGYSEAEAFQSVCLEDASRRAAGVSTVLQLASFLQKFPEFLLQHSLPGPPPGSPASPTTPCFNDIVAGQRFARSIFSSHRQPVHPLSAEAAFLMVVSFGRADFKLDVQSVERALDAVLGASGALLQVGRLADRVFRFAVRVTGF